ncbi:hypothetical protein [Pseudomonas sp. I3-I5]|uniref:hypothetical protein n=1 Tax=Pseudomonas sp. I3-I5 TaxID=2926671 RepID=UPI001F607F91|nr:hypothetical protein [Pseudomonas sp. I3-I5]UNT12038.1 hypothetical protein MOP87_13080 [Pseudomonas sp. I3-I5]
MTGEMWKLLCSLDLQTTTEKVEQGIALDHAQHSLLREVADAKFYHLMRKIQTDTALEENRRQQAEQQACTRVAHLMQTSCLALRRLELDADDQRLAREALESHQVFIKACLRRSLGSFDRSA